MRRMLGAVRQARPDAWLAAVILACVFAGGSERLPLASDQLQASDIVRATATTGTPDADGNQRVTVVIRIAPDWHIYANPAESTKVSATPTALTFRSERVSLEFAVDYPPGQLVQDPDFGEYRSYEGQVTIPAIVKRSAASAPFTVDIKFQACNDKRKTCLPPATITVNVSER
jgi:DsbC/DsbD-like thiol-disulfide interchange protein